MLAIRMQRTGRKGHAMFRVIAQDSRFSPTSGRVVANLGHYDPHTKAVTIDKEKIVSYLNNGAQPSPRVARLLKTEGVKLPKWVAVELKKEGKVRNADKRRGTKPVEEVTTEEVATEEVPAEPATVTEEAPTTEEPTNDTAPEVAEVEPPAKTPEAAEVATETPAETIPEASDEAKA